MSSLKDDLVAVGFCADDARLTAALAFLLKEEVFELDDLEGITSKQIYALGCLVCCYAG